MANATWTKSFKILLACFSEHTLNWPMQLIIREVAEVNEVSVSTLLIGQCNLKQHLLTQPGYSFSEHTLNWPIQQTPNLLLQAVLSFSEHTLNWPMQHKYNNESLINIALRNIIFVSGNVIFCNTLKKYIFCFA